MIDGILRLPLDVVEDERGGFCELRRDSDRPARMVQMGTAGVVVLDRETGATYTEDIGDGDRVALYILPGHHAHGFEALTGVFFCYHVTAEYDPADPDEHTIPWNDPRVAHLWSTPAPILSARDAVVS